MREKRRVSPLSLMSQTFAQRAFIVFFLASVVPLAMLAFVGDTYVLPQVKSPGVSLALQTAIVLTDVLAILSFYVLSRAAQKLPDLAKALGKGVAQFKGAMDDVKGTFDEGIKKEINGVKDSLLEDKGEKEKAGEGDKKEGAPPDPYPAAEEKKKKPATPA